MPTSKMKNDNVILKNQESIVFIGIQEKINKEQMRVSLRGTGMLLDTGEVLTCAHVYNEIPENLKESMFVGVMNKSTNKVNDYKSIPIRFVKKDDIHDIALLKISVSKDDKDYPKTGYSRESFSPLDEIENLEVGSEVIISGFPIAADFLNMGMGITLMACHGIIGNKKFNPNNDIDFLLIDKQITPGYSGSPVYQDGKIIGIASGTINQNHKIEGKDIAIPIGVGVVRTSNYILALLK